jgi:hypothetical protein
LTTQSVYAITMSDDSRQCAWLLASVRNPQVPRLELYVVTAQAEFVVQGLAEDESVDRAVGQFARPDALELFRIEEAFRVPANLRSDVPVEPREQTVEPVPNSVSSAAESLLLGSVPSRPTFQPTATGITDSSMYELVRFIRARWRGIRWLPA